MVVQAGFGVSHVLFDVHELLITVLAALHAVVAGLVFHVEWLRHIGAVQPNLPRVDGFVPEIAILGAGLGVQLGADGVDSIPVALFAGQINQGKQVFALVDVVQVMLVGVKGVDLAAILDKVVYKIAGELQELFIPGGLVQAQAGGDHAAVHIVPFIGLAAAHLFNVPQWGFGRAAGNQIIHIIAQGGQNLFMGHGLILLKAANVDKV